MPPLLYTVLLLFVQRQHIVYELLYDIRPDILFNTYNLSDDNIHAFMELTDEHINTPTTGFWGKNKEWRYSIHGRGCRIKHMDTDELIDWEIPDTLVFDRYWFTAYVEWFKEKTGYLSDLDTSNNLEEEMEEFVRMGLVEPVRSRFRLLFTFLSEG